MTSDAQTQTQAQAPTAGSLLPKPRRAARLAILAAGLVALSACGDRSREVTFVFPNGLPNGTPPAYTADSSVAGRLPPATEDPDAVSFLSQSPTAAPERARTAGTENELVAAPRMATADTQLDALATALTRRGTTILD